MTKKNPQPTKLSPQEEQLIERLVEHAELMERFRTILEITASADGPLKRADEVEGLLIEEMRRLGNTTMGSWAARAERRLAEQLKQKDASASERKKKAGVGGWFWDGGGGLTGLAFFPGRVFCVFSGRPWGGGAGADDGVGSGCYRTWVAGIP